MLRQTGKSTVAVGAQEALNLTLESQRMVPGGVIAEVRSWYARRSGEFERSEDMLGVVNIHFSLVWDKRKSGLEPETNDSGPQDLVFEALIWALGLNAHFIFYPSIRQQTS